MHANFSALLIGTRNQGKAAEIRTAFRDLDLQLLTLADIPHVAPAIETGSTYEENAKLKAKTYAQQSGMWTMADDSGLEVKALNGAPGVLSARFAGERASDQKRIDFLLEQLNNTPTTDRAARFVSVVALADSESQIIKIAYGLCPGRITFSPRGKNGFGYDPIFVPQGFDLTFGELASEVKDRISHRSVALRAMRHFISRFVATNLTHNNSNS